MSFTSCGSARFNWHSCTVASLKVPAMIVYDMVMNVLDTKWFPQHNIAGLISGITFVVLFQSGEASTVEGNTHTHTHTQVSKCISPSQINLIFIHIQNINSLKLKIVVIVVRCNGRDNTKKFWTFISIVVP